MIKQIRITTYKGQSKSYISVGHILTRYIKFAFILGALTLLSPNYDQNFISPQNINSFKDQVNIIDKGLISPN